MGCDIHPYLELKVGGHWIHIGTITSYRNYVAFAYLSGVRRYANDELPENVFGNNEELPHDVSPETTVNAEGGHSATCIPFWQLEKALSLLDKEQAKMVDMLFEWLKIMETAMDSDVVQDARVIAWYDN